MSPCSSLGHLSYVLLNGGNIDDKSDVVSLLECRLQLVSESSVAWDVKQLHSCSIFGLQAGRVGEQRGMRRCQLVIGELGHMPSQTFELGVVAPDPSCYLTLVNIAVLPASGPPAKTTVRLEWPERRPRPLETLLALLKAPEERTDVTWRCK